MVYLRSNYIGDEDQIKRINSKVGKNDTIIFLGDIGDLECVKRIRGYKILIKGNHDIGSSKYQKIEKHYSPAEYATLPDEVKKECRKVMLPSIGETYYYNNRLFDEVYEGTLQINSKIMLSHEPVDYEYCFNIHGHDHSNWHRSANHLNLCAEHINYTPVNLGAIIKQGLFKDIPDVHRETIDNATAKKLAKK
jgi:calcineurin-like phosphoesterase family protein